MGVGPFRIGNECPVHSIAGNLPWEPSDFYMKRKGLAASLGAGSLPIRSRYRLVA